jgi:hypothetical protein
MHLRLRRRWDVALEETLGDLHGVAFSKLKEGPTKDPTRIGFLITSRGGGVGWGGVGWGGVGWVGVGNEEDTPSNELVKCESPVQEFNNTGTDGITHIHTHIFVRSRTCNGRKEGRKETCLSSCLAL